VGRQDAELPSPAVELRVDSREPGARTASGTLWAILRTLRVYQWTKNALVLAPLVLAHQVHDRVRLMHTLLAIVLFCLGASAVYVCNDALDVHDDRRHATKRRRPFAAGELPLSMAPVLLLVLLALSLVPAYLLLPWRFFVLLAGYLVLSSAYSFWLKRKLLVDVIVLAGLYTMRILAGGAAAEVEVSPWLLAFSIFLFLSLAFAKRYTELAAATKLEQPGALRGRGYMPEDLQIIQSVGPSSGYMAVLVFALYIHNSQLVTQLYRRPILLWLICPLLLYWITRIWFLARRGAIADDPLLFALTDRVSWYAAIVAALLVYFASV
jgi:4-hydroxybenzoate polyprenyltransferase